MNKNIYLVIDGNNKELLYYINNIINPIKLETIKNGFVLLIIDETIEIHDLIKTIETDFYVDIQCFIDDLNLKENFLDYIYNFLITKTSGVYRLTDLLEDIVLTNNKEAKQDFKKLLQSKLSQETIDTGLGFIKYGNVLTASRELFIHRNTLNYRIESIKKNTSLDLKVFTDQLAFYGLFK